MAPGICTATARPATARLSRRRKATTSGLPDGGRASLLEMTSGDERDLVRAWSGTEDNWLGGPATMWWSHADAATYRAWLGDAGLEVTEQEFVPEGDGGQALFWARRPHQALE